MKTIPPAPGTRPAPSGAQDLAFSVEREQGPEQPLCSCDRISDCALVSLRTKSTRCDAAVPGLEGDASSERLGVRQARLELDRRGLRTSETVWSHARWSRPSPIGTSVRTRSPGTESKAERADQADVARVPGWIPARKRPNRQVQADNGTDSRCDEDVQPRSDPALNAAQLGWRDAGCLSDGCQRQTRSARAARISAPRSASRRRPRRAPRHA